MNLKVYAVGSSRSIGREIEESANQIFDRKIPIERIQTREVAYHTDGDIYICNPSQQEALREYVDDEKIVLLNIAPTPQFYLRIAAIPAGSAVHIVNSQSNYIRKLIDYCRNMGIENLDFIPIPYQELDEAEVCRLLGEAHYLAGVDRLLNEDILGNEKFAACLRSDVTVIGAKRTAALPSIYHAVRTVNDLIFRRIIEDLESLQQQARGSTGEMLYLNYPEINEKLSEIRELVSRSGGRDTRFVMLALRQLTIKPDNTI